ncbi:MAG: class I SAM-dependent methyltransferase [Bacteroidota bacterium]
MQQNATTEFLQILAGNYHAGQLVKLTLSKPRQKKSDLKNIIISPVNLKAGMMLHFVYRYSTRDITKNAFYDDAVPIILEALHEVFLQADMYIEGGNVKLLFNKKGQSRLLQNKVEVIPKTSFEHNRTKGHWIETKGNLWLKELGITNEAGEVRHEMKDKYRQINRYVELLEPELRLLPPNGTLRVADMGSGKGYLTFALYDFLHHKLGISAEVTGVEYRNDLVNTCNTIADHCNFDHLHFVQGTIEETTLTLPHVLIALHACNTATDEAIYRGIATNAQLIVCAPCCHKQIRKEMEKATGLMPLLKHGILLERQAELITDGLRAMIMEAFGYKTKVFEFISSEHTAKNIMIVGRKVNREGQYREQILEQVRGIKTSFGIGRHYLEDLLGL